MDALPERVRASPDAVAQRLGDEMVLVNLKTDRILVLNRTGARFWELLCVHQELNEIRKRLLQEFDITESQLADEIAGFLTELNKEQLIRPDDASSRE